MCRTDHDSYVVSRLLRFTSIDLEKNTNQQLFALFTYGSGKLYDRELKSNVVT